MRKTAKLIIYDSDGLEGDEGDEQEYENSLNEQQQDNL